MASVNLVFDLNYDAHDFAFWRGLVAIHDLEPALAGVEQFAEPGIGITGKLLAGHTGIFGGLFDHAGFDAVEVLKEKAGLTDGAKHQPLTHQGAGGGDGCFD